MATADFVDDTECCICSELFNTPKLLPCSHTVCKQCLVSWLTANAQAQCPTCRQAIVDPEKPDSKDKRWEEVVDALPTDLATEALVESTSVLSKSHACTGCRNNAAVSICLTCGDKLCRACCDVHQNLSATRHHKVEDLSAVTPERLAASQSTSCSFHSNKPAELFCPVHGAAICHLCASSEHRSCPDVILFDRRVDQLRAELGDMSTMLTTAEVKLDDAIRQLDRQLMKVEEYVQETVDSIDADCDRLEKVVKDCRSRLTGRALNGVAQIKDKVQAVKDTFLQRKGGLTTHRVSVDRVKRAMPAKFLNQVNPTLQSKIKDLDLTAALPSDVKDISSSLKLLSIDRKSLKQIEMELTKLDFDQVNERKKIRELPRKDVQLQTKIVDGTLGKVYKGIFKKRGPEPKSAPTNITVAVKTCQNTSSDDRKDFLEEAHILREFNHPNIVTVIGIVTKCQSFMIVMEFVPGGNLESFLQRGGNQSQRQLIKMCMDVASGMTHLVDRGYIHCDLRAGNCLVGAQNVIKISSFRRAVMFGAVQSLRFPIRWTAPEVLACEPGTPSSLSDVWSYGILMWEIFSGGREPYPEMTKQKVEQRVIDGYRMPQDKIPDSVYDLMLLCWEYTPEMRPHFKDIYDSLLDIL